MRGRLHRGPYVRIGEHRNVVVDADIGNRGVRTIGAIVGEREMNRPDQRKDVDREQQDDRRRDEKPGDDPIGQAPHASRQGLGRGARCLVQQDVRVGRVHHRRIIDATGTAPRGAAPGTLRTSGAGERRYLILPSSLNTLVQSATSRSNASFAVPLSATT